MGIFYRMPIWHQKQRWCSGFRKNLQRADFQESAFYNTLFAKSTKQKQGQGGAQWLAECTYSCRKIRKGCEKSRGQSSMAEAQLSGFGRNPRWLTSTPEIKAVICLKRLNNVSDSVKHTSAALCIMHQRPLEGQAEKDNTTYPGGTGRGEEELRGSVWRI